MRKLTLEVVVFCLSRGLDAVSLLLLLYVASALEDWLPLTDGIDVYGLYLVVRAYFVLLGYLAVSVLFFVAIEFTGGLRSPARLMLLNVGVPLLHGLILGMLLRTATPSYWSVGAGMLVIAALASRFVWWPWLAPVRSTGN